MRVGVVWALSLLGCTEGPAILDIRVVPLPCDPHRPCERAVALGADVPLIGGRSTQIGLSLLRIDSVKVDPPELAEATRAGYEYTLHTLAPGTAQITGEVDGDSAILELPIVPAHVGPIVVPDAPAGAKAFGVYLGSARPILQTALVDAAGTPVAGHGLEQWSPENKLQPVPEGSPGQRRFFDPALVRSVSVGADPVTVSNGADTVTFVGRPLGSAARLTLSDATTGEDQLPATAIVVGRTGQRDFRVWSFAADDLPLLGDGGPTNVSFSPPRAMATMNRAARTFAVTGTSAGTAKMTVTYDGATATYDVTVQ